MKDKEKGELLNRIAELELQLGYKDDELKRLQIRYKDVIKYGRDLIESMRGKKL